MTAAANRIELLNRLGQALAMSMGSRSGYPAILHQVRRILDLSAVSLWVIDRGHALLVKEALEADPAIGWNETDLQMDEKLAHYQHGQHGRHIIRGSAGSDAALRRSDEIVLSGIDYPRSCISLPILHKESQLIGVLNLYSEGGDQWYFDAQHESESAEFLRSVAGQLGLFIENRSLEANTTFYKEIHHRVKNNLQTVASILRMQIRRLDTVSAEQALEDSINRILSIALVHETLSQGEIGLVNFGGLLSRIAHLLTADVPDAPRLDVHASGPPLMISSREATALALVANELMTNALYHGAIGGKTGGPESSVVVRLTRIQNEVCLEVQDSGPGLPAAFDLQRDGHLGLTIVATLVDEELRGQFSLHSGAGTTATVIFPLPAASPHGASAMT